MTPRKRSTCPQGAVSGADSSTDREQGLNHAICDVTNFVAAIKKVKDGEAELKDAISAYDAEVVKRGAIEVISSRESAYMMLDWNKIMEAPIMTRALEKSGLEE